jgi:hypothetical protein
MGEACTIPLTRRTQWEYRLDCDQLIKLAFDERRRNQEVKVSFQARRLRVQLPCGDQTVVEADVIKPTPTACPWATCGFVTPTICAAYNTNCGIVSPCHQFHTILQCQHFVTPVCAMNTFACGCTVTFIDPCGGAGSGDPGPIQIDPEVLPQLREQLEAQLKEIEKAEAALKEREG